MEGIYMLSSLQQQPGLKFAGAPRHNLVLEREFGAGRICYASPPTSLPSAPRRSASQIVNGIVAALLLGKCPGKGRHRKMPRTTAAPAQAFA